MYKYAMHTYTYAVVYLFYFLLVILKNYLHTTQINKKNLKFTWNITFQTQKLAKYTKWGLWW